jgi:hypothetical protein
MKVIISNDKIKSLKKGQRREDRKQAGLMDGRFREKVVKDKSKYSRKKKHKNI